METHILIQAIESREERIRSSSTRVIEEKKDDSFLLLGFNGDFPLYILHQWNLKKNGSDLEYQYAYIFFLNGEVETMTTGEYFATALRKEVIERAYKFSSSVLTTAIQCKDKTKFINPKYGNVPTYRFIDDLKKMNQNTKYWFTFEANKISYGKIYDIESIQD
jgi:hypothetical protein